MRGDGLRGECAHVIHAAVQCRDVVGAGSNRGCRQYLRARLPLEHQLHRARLLWARVHLDLATVRCGDLELVAFEYRPVRDLPAGMSDEQCLRRDRFTGSRTAPATAPFSASNWSAPSASSIDAANTIQDLVCPTGSLCIAADDAGNVLTSTTPPFGASSWSASAVDPFRTITGVACSLNVFCVIGDDAGNVLAGTPTLPVNTAAPTSAAARSHCRRYDRGARIMDDNPTSYSINGRTVTEPATRAP